MNNIESITFFDMQIYLNIFHTSKHHQQNKLLKNKLAKKYTENQSVMKLQE
jgi:hypothetical protein